jgi:hypothetical protein
MDRDVVSPAAPLILDLQELYPSVAHRTRPSGLNSRAFLIFLQRQPHFMSQTKLEKLSMGGCRTCLQNRPFKRCRRSRKSCGYAFSHVLESVDALKRVGGTASMTGRPADWPPHPIPAAAADALR